MTFLLISLTSTAISTHFDRMKGNKEGTSSTDCMDPVKVEDLAINGVGDNQQEALEAHNDTKDPCINNYLENVIFEMDPHPFPTLYVYECLIRLYQMLQILLLEALMVSDSTSEVIFKT